MRPAHRCLHGTCVNKHGGYKCICSPGWTGQNCLQQIDKCARNPCQHGRCVNRNLGYMCTCSPGWTGHNCQEDINECVKILSACNHGRCQNQEGGYKCTCSPGWTGQNCQQARRCQHGWSEHNNHCYKLVNKKVSFSTAYQKCKGMGANLASISDGQENSFIASIISDASDDMVWIGLQHKRWTDGSAVSYKNWAPGQPDDNWFFGGENCIVIYKNDGRDAWIFTSKRYKGEWNDRKCSDRKPFICKKPK
ncbi:aggrecan core protein-like [Branchiostoma floridae x Branchiostoma belcheri]